MSHLSGPSNQMSVRFKSNLSYCTHNKCKSADPLAVIRTYSVIDYLFFSSYLKSKCLNNTVRRHSVLVVV